MPGIIGGALMAFTLSLDDYLITAFTKGVRDQTMPIYIFGLVRRGVTPEINALSTLLLGGSIGLVGLSQLAQGGGALYTRAMAIGAGIGLGLYGLAGLPDATSTAGLVAHVLLLFGFVAAWRSVQGYREEFALANSAGRWLSVFTMGALAAAMFVSILILTS